MRVNCALILIGPQVRGGQHVNKTDSAIRLTHIPTGIVVQCQNERSQLQNRAQAFAILSAKLVEKQRQDRLTELAKISWQTKWK